MVTTCMLRLSKLQAIRGIAEWNCDLEQQLKCASENRGKELCNETQRVRFQISKLATIITFESRKRSKTLKGSRILQTSGKTPHQRSPEIDTFLHFDHRTVQISINVPFTLQHILHTEHHWAPKIKLHFVLEVRQTKLENDLFYVWQQPASPHCLYTIKYRGTKLLDRSSGHIHCYKCGCNKYPDKGNNVYVTCAEIELKNMHLNTHIYQSLKHLICKLCITIYTVSNQPKKSCFVG